MPQIFLTTSNKITFFVVIMSSTDNDAIEPKAMELHDNKSIKVLGENNWTKTPVLKFVDYIFIKFQVRLMLNYNHGW